MANKGHLKILRQGVDSWNEWRKENINIKPDLRGSTLAHTNFVGADLHGANLNSADLSRANLATAVLIDAKLKNANLSKASLYAVKFIRANLEGANLCGADLQSATMVDTNVENASLSECSIYGLSAWGLKGTPRDQLNLIITRNYDTGWGRNDPPGLITPEGESAITMDGLEVAQFVYLLLDNKKIRDVIDTMGKKAVLILGRFTEQRKAVLDLIKDELRKYEYLPIIFDFAKPATRDLTETVSILAHMARFIVADITDAKSIPAELQLIAPTLRTVPIQPLILTTDYEYALFRHIERYPHVLKVYRYENEKELISSFSARVISPAETKANEIEEKRKK